jgi:hypothetical protein
MAGAAVFAEALDKKLSVKWNSCPPCPVLFEDVFEKSTYFSTDLTAIPQAEVILRVAGGPSHSG